VEGNLTVFIMVDNLSILFYINIYRFVKFYMN